MKSLNGQGILNIFRERKTPQGQTGRIRSRKTSWHKLRRGTNNAYTHIFMKLLPHKCVWYFPSWESGETHHQGGRLLQTAVEEMKDCWVEEEKGCSLWGKVRRRSLPSLLRPQADFKWRGKNNLAAYAHTHTLAIGQHPILQHTDKLQCKCACSTHLHAASCQQKVSCTNRVTGRRGGQRGSPKICSSANNLLPKHHWHSPIQSLSVSPHPSFTLSASSLFSPSWCCSLFFSSFLVYPNADEFRFDLTFTPV